MPPKDPERYAEWRETQAAHLRKLADARRGQPLSPETRARISAAKKGRPHSSEHRAKLAAVLQRVNEARRTP